MAIGQFSRQSGNVQRTLAPGHFAGATGGLTGAGGIDDLSGDSLRFERILQQKLLQFFRHHPFNYWFDLGGNQLVLGLRRKLGIVQFHRQYSGEALTRIIATGLDLGFFQNPFRIHVLVHGASQSAAQTS